MKARISELEKQLKLTLEENTSFKETISKFKFELNSVREETSKEIFQLKQDKVSLKNHIEAQFNQINEQKDQMKSKDQEIDFLISQKEAVKRDNEDMSQKLIAHEEENYGFKKTQLDILVQLKYLQAALKKEQEKSNTLSAQLEQSQAQCQSQAMSLKYAQSKIAELQSKCEQLANNQAIYIGKAGDQIDMAMANFLNRYPERKQMKILFLRESEGVYKFGQRRVHVKVERGNEVLVRVGGGFISVQKFIETYMQSEVDRVERHDIVGRFEHKLQAQRISAS